MIEEKKCFGNGIAIGYGCGKKVHVSKRKYGLGLDCCFKNWATQTKSGKEKLKKSSIKVSFPSNSDQQNDFDSDLKTALKETKTVVHAFVRERDKGKNCICCGAKYDKSFQCCHLFKAELYETLRFNLFNLNGGCKTCNLFLEGNLEKYHKNLPLRIGQDNYDELVRLAGIDKQFSKVWDVDSLGKIVFDIQNLKQ